MDTTDKQHQAEQTIPYRTVWLRYGTEHAHYPSTRGLVGDRRTAAERVQRDVRRPRRSISGGPPVRARRASVARRGRPNWWGRSPAPPNERERGKGDYEERNEPCHRRGPQGIASAILWAVGGRNGPCPAIGVAAQPSVESGSPSPGGVERQREGALPSPGSPFPDCLFHPCSYTLYRHKQGIHGWNRTQYAHAGTKTGC